jgi:hypothetical protein
MGLPAGDVVVDSFNATSGEVSFRFVGAKGAAATNELKAMSPAQAGAKLQLTGFAARDEQATTNGPSASEGPAGMAVGTRNAIIVVAAALVVAVAVGAALIMRQRSKRQHDANMQGLSTDMGAVGVADLTSEMGGMASDPIALPLQQSV